MSTWGRIMNGLSGAVSGFREAYLHADDPSSGSTVAGYSGHDAWSDYGSRRLRYALQWAFWQNDAYRNVHAWSQRMRSDYGMYRHVRHIYNPSHRIGEFFVCHTFNGPIDAKAGNGAEAPSSIPIHFGKELGKKEGVAIREGIAKLWQDSRWQSAKSTWVRNGAVMGDSPLLVEDDPTEGKVRLKPIHPSTLKWVDVNSEGRVVASIREESRYDPAGLKSLRNVLGDDPVSSVKRVTYTQEMMLSGDGVEVRTYLDGRPYDWGEGPEGAVQWLARWPAVPLVLTQHIPIGGMFGMAEAHSTLPKIREADDQVSKLNDQIRKLVECPWLFTGLTQADVNTAVKANRTASTSDNPENSRQSMVALYAADPKSRAHALVADMKIGEVSAHIGTILDEIEKDHPELRYDRLVVSGALSGTALRKSRQSAETKLRERRAEYDGSLAYAQALALSIGSIAGYAGYPRGGSVESFRSGRFLHEIGDRPVFAVDALDRREEDMAEANAVKVWVEAGIPLETALRRVGWSEEDVLKVVEQKAESSRQAMELAGMSASTMEDEDDANSDDPESDGRDGPADGKADIGEDSAGE